jgi:adenine-specific DNA-methyltransferase
LAVTPSFVEVRVQEYRPAPETATMTPRRLHRAEEDDWRAWVDAIDIDPAHDGVIFHCALSDAPAKKRVCVDGVYRLPAPPTPVTVAVRITDVFGQETVVTQIV